MFHHIRSGICLFILLISHISFASQHTQPDDFILISSTILQPVYGPLAEQIADDFDLADMKGMGIDLGSGPGDLIIELCKRNQIEIYEKAFSLFDVYSADEAFVTGTFAGVTYVSQVDGRVIGNGHMGPMSKHLKTLYAGLLEEECPAETALG